MITNDFDKEWIKLHESITKLEENTNDERIMSYISIIDCTLKQLETHLDNNYHWKLRN